MSIVGLKKNAPPEQRSAGEEAGTGLGGEGRSVDHPWGGVALGVAGAEELAREGGEDDFLLLVGARHALASLGRHAQGDSAARVELLLLDLVLDALQHDEVPLEEETRLLRSRSGGEEGGSRGDVGLDDVVSAHHCGVGRFHEEELVVHPHGAAAQVILFGLGALATIPRDVVGGRGALGFERRGGRLLRRRVLPLGVARVVLLHPTEDLGRVRWRRRVVLSLGRGGAEGDEDEQEDDADGAGHGGLQGSHGVVHER